MARYFIVRTRAETLTESGAPDAQTIARAFREALDGSGGSVIAQHGVWVGPRPRVTRVRDLTGWATLTPPYRTRAVWLVAWDGTPERQANEARFNGLLAGTVHARLRDLTGAPWFDVLVEPFTERLHGNLRFWQSGEAAVTRTQDEFPGFVAGQVDAQDNPSGPTTPETHPTTPGGAARQAAEGAARAGDVVGDLVVGAVALALGWGAVSAWRAARAAGALPDPRPSLRRGLARARGALRRPGRAS